MEYLLIASGVGLVILGFALGVLFTALVVVSVRDKRPEPRPVRPHAVRASRPEVRESSWAGVGASRRSRAVVGSAEPTDAFSGTTERDST